VKPLDPQRVVATAEPADSFRVKLDLVSGYACWLTPVDLGWDRVTDPIALTSDRHTAVPSQQFLTSAAAAVTKLRHRAGVDDECPVVQRHCAASGELAALFLGGWSRG
jgi:hypothetical protein